MLEIDKHIRGLILLGRSTPSIATQLIEEYGLTRYSAEQKIEEVANKLMRGKSNPKSLCNPTIPRKLLEWRAKQPEGAIMSSKTFDNIVKAAMKKGLSKIIATKIAGKAYWQAAKARYKAAMKKNPGTKWHEIQEKGSEKLRDLAITESNKQYFQGKIAAHKHSKEVSTLLKINPKITIKWYIGSRKGLSDLWHGEIFSSSTSPSLLEKEYGYKYGHVYGPFDSKKEVETFRGIREIGKR